MPTWGKRTLGAARRRLVRRRPSPAALVSPVPDVLLDVEVALAGSETDAFVRALEARLGRRTQRLNSPARIADAIGAAIALAGGRGAPTVRRRPGGLYTPEAWQIRVEAADAATRAELDRLTQRRAHR